ncbi:TIGR04211 family SH3 domain-containing protein [Aliikangiella sp. IMCC44359]|uniref:TIGR04211 family SH3 domain-containing protein n=1 Tax=Aliikangiella sp. IMCC44359 TaxID=3459125 RepID=UPI00403AC19D
MKNLIIFAILLFGTINIVLAETGYINDQTKIWTRTGPSNDYKVKYKLTPGTKFEILQKNEETQFMQIRDESGRVSWLSPEFYSDKPTAGRLLAETRRTLANFKQSHDDKINSLEKQIIELKPLEKANQSLQEELAKLQQKYEAIRQEKQAYERRFSREYFFAGAVVVLGGMFLGWLLSKLGGRNRNNGWS